MKKSLIIASIVALMFTSSLFASESAVVPGSWALACSDLSSKEFRDPERGQRVLASMAEGFARSQELSVIPQEKVNQACERLFFLRGLASDSLGDAIALGSRLEAEAVVVASLAVVDDIAALTLRLYETEGERRIAEESNSGPVNTITERLDSGIEALLVAWEERAALPALLPQAEAAGASPRAQIDLAFLAGYTSVIAMSWELEGSLPSMPLSFGAEFAYEKIDPLALPGDILSLSLIGRWWPLEGLEKRGLVIELAAGGSLDMHYGLLAGPFRLAAGWTLSLEGQVGPFARTRPLRVQPELGITWSMRPRWSKDEWVWEDYQYVLKKGRYVGFFPFAGLKIDL